MVDTAEAFRGTLTGEVLLDWLSALRSAESSEGNDILVGSQDPDQIAGEGGNDLVLGLAGNDSLYGDAAAEDWVPLPPDEVPPGGDDLILGGAGTDSIWGGMGSDTILGGGGDDQIFGGVDVRKMGLSATNTHDAADLLLGGAGNDTIAAGGGDDTLRGGQGDDVLTGNQGVDRISGGAGADTFVFGTPRDYHKPILGTELDTGVGQGNRDVITDFTQGEDIINIAQITYLNARAGHPYEFIGTDAFTGGEGGFIRYEVQGDHTIVQIDVAPPDTSVPSDGVVDAEIELVGVHALTATDFEQYNLIG